MADNSPLEGLGVMFADIYRNKKVLVTGHTGFKGSWLAFWLTQMGANVYGLALEPDTDPNHWSLLNLDIQQKLMDIGDYQTLTEVISVWQPDMVFHLAAQPIVRLSYTEPRETWSTNVMGTVNLLEACRHTPSIKAIVVITSDKCYENHEKKEGYLESDRLGGHDPYSASKAATELVVDSYRKSFFEQQDVLLASARAGNVIGGGDWSVDRLIPDAVRSITTKMPLEVRSPQSSRPWQHVLDSLSGYLLLGQKLLERKQTYAQAWNFGPDAGQFATVSDVLESIHAHWPAFSWQIAKRDSQHETICLGINSDKARKQLDWQSVWDLTKATENTALWYKRLIENGQLDTVNQLQNYIDDATKAGVCWL
jgi:CDP-glucose 4,6-dehydratase